MDKTSIDDIAGKLPSVEFKKKKKANQSYIQKMQSIRGGRQFLLYTSEMFPNGSVRITLEEYGDRIGEVITIGNRYAMFNDAESIHAALKSLERKAKCKLYYVLLISTDGEYL